MKFYITTICFLGSLSSFGQKDILGKWKFECVVMDRDTIFLRNDSMRAFKNEEKKRFRDTLGRRLMNLEERPLDTMQALSMYKAHAAGFISFKQENKSEWYIPIRPDDKNEKPGAMYYKIADKQVIFYEDAAKKKAAIRFNKSYQGNLLHLESNEGVRTIFILSRK